MSQRATPVDFGILPFSTVSDDNGSSRSSMRGTSLMLAEAFARKMEWTGIQWSSDHTTVLDYQCGSGLMSQILAPYVKHIIGVDPSDINVNEYNRKAVSQQLYPTKLRGYPGDLSVQHTDSRLEHPEFYNLDVVILGLGFHQFPYPQMVLMHVFRRLKVGGTVLIMDYASLYQGYPSTANQYGFMKSELRGLLEQQGLVNVDVETLTDSEGNIILENEGQRHIVLAKGVKRANWPA
ncbi:S-adenosyl-L-methionine-dependent methyltransferase [Kalaharituber pfeilii]|nr:S-adenosyl-L-methionine-dependent methyltransferase [Kalaharituber pfeilii]